MLLVYMSNLFIHREVVMLLKYDDAPWVTIGDWFKHGIEFCPEDT